MRSKCAAANQSVKAALVIALPGRFARDVGWTDRFVSLLGAGAFGVIIANFNVVFAVSVFDKACHASERLLAKVQAVGTVVGNKAGLVEALSGIHSSAS